MILKVRAFALRWHYAFDWPQRLIILCSFAGGSALLAAAWLQLSHVVQALAQEP